MYIYIGVYAHMKAYKYPHLVNIFFIYDRYIPNHGHVLSRLLYHEEKNL